MLYLPNAELHFRATLANRRRNMAANLEDQLIDKVRALPPEKQQEALRLLDTLATGASSEGTSGIADPFGRSSTKSTLAYPQTLGRMYRPTARSTLIIISTERRRSSRESGIVDTLYLWLSSIPETSGMSTPLPLAN